MAYQSDYQHGRKHCIRKGIQDGYLHRGRKQATIKQIDEWIKHYTKLVENGEFCPIRGQKIIDNFENMRYKKIKKLERNKKRYGT